MCDAAPFKILRKKRQCLQNKSSQMCVNLYQLLISLHSQQNDEKKEENYE